MFAKLYGRNGFGPGLGVSGLVESVHRNSPVPRQGERRRFSGTGIFRAQGAWFCSKPCGSGGLALTKIWVLPFRDERVFSLESMAEGLDSRYQ